MQYSPRVERVISFLDGFGDRHDKRAYIGTEEGFLGVP